ncbi:RHS repeat-associated core domain-containing protein [bacterium]|nr:RHS repeat-associated core domain-containing protein [bacterium]
MTDEAYAYEVIRSGSGVSNLNDAFDPYNTVSNEIALGGVDDSHGGGYREMGCAWNLEHFWDLTQRCDSPGACNIGQPINPVTGTMYHDEVDLYVDAGLLPLIVSRRYSAGPIKEMPFRKSANWMYPEFASAAGMEAETDFGAGFDPSTYCQSHVTTVYDPINQVYNSYTFCQYMGMPLNQVGGPTQGVYDLTDSWCGTYFVGEDCDNNVNPIYIRSDEDPVHMVPIRLGGEGLGAGWGDFYETTLYAPGTLFWHDPDEDNDGYNRACFRGESTFALRQPAPGYGESAGWKYFRLQGNKNLGMQTGTETVDDVECSIFNEDAGLLAVSTSGEGIVVGDLVPYWDNFESRNDSTNPYHGVGSGAYQTNGNIRYLFDDWGRLSSIQLLSPPVSGTEPSVLEGIVIQRDSNGDIDQVYYAGDNPNDHSRPYLDYEYAGVDPMGPVGAKYVDRITVHDESGLPISRVVYNGGGSSPLFTENIPVNDVYREDYVNGQWLLRSSIHYTYGAGLSHRTELDYSYIYNETTLQEDVDVTQSEMGWSFELEDIDTTDRPLDTRVGLEYTESWIGPNSGNARDYWSADRQVVGEEPNQLLEVRVSQQNGVLNEIRYYDTNYNRMFCKVVLRDSAAGWADSVGVATYLDYSDYDPDRLEAMYTVVDPEPLNITDTINVNPPISAAQDRPRIFVTRYLYAEGGPDNQPRLTQTVSGMLTDVATDTFYPEFVSPSLGRIAPSSLYVTGTLPYIGTSQFETWTGQKADVDWGSLYVPKSYADTITEWTAYLEGTAPYPLAYEIDTSPEQLLSGPAIGASTTEVVIDSTEIPEVHANRYTVSQMGETRAVLETHYWTPILPDYYDIDIMGYNTTDFSLRIRLTWDTLGRLESYQVSNQAESTVYYKSPVTTYDSLGRIVSVNSPIIPDVSQFSSNFSYEGLDQLDNILTVILSPDQPAVSTLTEFDADGRGRIREVRTSDQPAANFLSETRYKYDDMGFLKSVSSVLRKGLTSTVTQGTLGVEAEYDDYGNLESWGVGETQTGADPLLHTPYEEAVFEDRTDRLVRAVKDREQLAYQAPANVVDTVVHPTTLGSPHWIQRRDGSTISLTPMPQSCQSGSVVTPEVIPTALISNLGLNSAMNSVTRFGASYSESTVELIETLFETVPQFGLLPRIICGPQGAVRMHYYYNDARVETNRKVSAGIEPPTSAQTYNTANPILEAVGTYLLSDWGSPTAPRKIGTVAYFYDVYERLSTEIIRRPNLPATMAGEDTLLFQTHDYDDAGRLEKIGFYPSDPTVLNLSEFGRDTEYHYNAAGQTTGKSHHLEKYNTTAFAGSPTFSVTGDLDGLLNTETEYDGAGRPVKVEHFSWKLVSDRLVVTTVKVPLYTFEYTYDSMGMISTVNQQGGPSVGWDATNGRAILTETFPDSVPGTTAEDERINGMFREFEYDTFGHLLSETRTYYRTGYGQQYTDPAQATYRIKRTWTYTYGTEGNLEQISEAPASPDAGWTGSSSYLPLNTSFTIDEPSFDQISNAGYSYNLLGAAGQVPATGAEFYHGLSQEFLSAVSNRDNGDPAIHRWMYDATGRRIAEKTIRMALPEPPPPEGAVAPSEELVAQSEGIVALSIPEITVLNRTEFIYNGWNLAAELDPGTGETPTVPAAVRWLYYHEGGLDSAVGGSRIGAEGPEDYVVIRDHLGSPVAMYRVVEDSVLSGGIIPLTRLVRPPVGITTPFLALEPVERYEYSPYGEPMVHAVSNDQWVQVTSGAGYDLTGTLTTQTELEPRFGPEPSAGEGFASQSSVGWRMLYTGREWDAAARLYNYRHRWYAPQLGRFVSRDPIGYGGGLNQYVYVRGNPVMRRDPWGLESFSEWERDYTWGAPQAALGTIYAGLVLSAGNLYNLALGDGELAKVDIIDYDGTIEIVGGGLPLSGGAITLPPFIWYEDEIARDSYIRRGYGDARWCEIPTQVHEHSHVPQSRELGPLYLPAGVPGFFLNALNGTNSTWLEQDANRRAREVMIEWGSETPPWRKKQPSLNLGFIDSETGGSSV